MEKRKSKNIFLCGCGGGYDIYGCLPFYFKFQSNGIDELTLINYSFTERNLLIKYGQQLTQILFRINPNEKFFFNDEIYFPELRLANELQISIYAILCNYRETTIELIIQAYQYLIQQRIIDEIILIDCGCDILLRGNEQGLGTPVEDMSHARAIHLLSLDQVKAKYIVVIGTNIDTGHGIIQSDIDQRLTQLSSFIVFKWLWKYENDDDVRRYVQVVSRCNPQHSIVHSLVCAALQGHRGFYLPEHLRSRITKSKVELKEETCLSIGYHLDDVIQDNIYFDQLTSQMNLNDVRQTIYAANQSQNSNEKVNEKRSSQRSATNIENSCFSRLLLCAFFPKSRTSRSPKGDLD